MVAEEATMVAEETTMVAEEVTMVAEEIMVVVEDFAHLLLNWQVQVSESALALEYLHVAWKGTCWKTARLEQDVGVEDQRLHCFKGLAQ